MDDLVPDPISHKQFPFAIIALSFFTLLLLSLTTYLAYQNRQLTQQLADINTIQQTIPSSTPTPNPTATWKTYTYKDVSFRYPNDWLVRNDTISSLYPPDLASGTFLPAITFHAIDNPENLSVQAYDEKISKEGMDPGLYSAMVGSNEVIAEKIMIAGVTGYLMRDANCEPVRCDHFSFSYNKKIYVFNNVYEGIDPASPTNRKAAMRSIFDKMLSTFKFSNNPTVSFPKKHFLPTDTFFENTPYPNELTSLQESDLIGFTCSDKYSKQVDGSFVAYNNTTPGSPKTLTNPLIINYVTSKEAGLQKGSLLSVMTCQTESGSTILSYEITPGGGGAGASVYYGFFNGDTTAVAEIPMENGPYFSCSNILALTKSNTLYAICGAGDGGYGSKSLYRVGLMKAYTSDLLLKCTSTVMDEKSVPTTTCSTKL